MWILRLWLITLALLIPSLARAACSGTSPNLTAASNSVTDVQACVTAAAASGDTITVPAGTGSVTWTTPLTVTNKCFTLQGPGSGLLTIKDGSNMSDVTNYGIIHWTMPSTGLCRITGFTFDQNNNAGNISGANTPMMLFNGSTQNFRFDSSIIKTYNYSSMHFHDNVRGVVDHLTFHQMVGNSNIGIYVFHEKWNDNYNGCGGGVVANGCGDASWAAATNFGSLPDALYFEDNTWDVNGNDFGGGSAVYAIDSWSGGRYVGRFNTLIDTVFANHGTETARRSRSSRMNEIYNNSFEARGSSIASVFGTRGGTGRFFNIKAFDTYNSISPVYPHDGFLGGTGSMVSGTYYRWGCDGGTPTDCNSAIWWRADPQTVTITSSGTTATVTFPAAHDLTDPANAAVGAPTINITGDTGNHFNGNQVITAIPTSTTATFTFAGCSGCSGTGTIKANSPWDNNSSGYPSMDMVGAGQDAVIMGSGFYPSVRAANQAREPVYSWKILRNGSNAPADGHLPQVMGTDWIDYNASFNGTTQHGIGIGSRASRPSSCAVNDGWWATNDATNWNTSTTETYSALFGYSAGQDGALDICTSSNTWTNAVYTPATYPHPLISGVTGGGGGSPTTTGTFSGAGTFQ